MWILLFDLGCWKLWGQCPRGQGEGTDNRRKDKMVYLGMEPEIEMRLFISLIFFHPLPPPPSPTFLVRPVGSSFSNRHQLPSGSHSFLWCLLAAIIPKCLTLRCLGWKLGLLVSSSECSGIYKLGATSWCLKLPVLFSWPPDTDWGGEIFLEADPADKKLCVRRAERAADQLCSGPASRSWGGWVGAGQASAHWLPQPVALCLDRLVRPWTWFSIPWFITSLPGEFSDQKEKKKKGNLTDLWMS